MLYRCRLPTCFALLSGARHDRSQRGIERIWTGHVGGAGHGNIGNDEATGMFDCAKSAHCCAFHAVQIMQYSWETWDAIVIVATVIVGTRGM